MPVAEGRADDGADRADDGVGREPAWGTLATVVIDRYDALPPLRSLRAAVAEAGEILGRAGFKAVDLSADGRSRSVVDALAEWRPRARRVVLHWAGHGKAVDNNAFFLLCRDSPAAAEPDWRRAVPAQVLGELLADLRVAETVLLLDVCGAGGAAAEVVNAFRSKVRRHAPPAPALAVISSAGQHQAARESALSRSIAAVLRDGPPHDRSYLPWTDRDSHIRPTELAEAVIVTLRDLSAGMQLPELDITGPIRPFFPNPRHRHAVPDADLESGATARGHGPLSPEAAEHFMAKFRGLDATEEQGWHFTGRTAVLRRLVAWLGDGRGIRVVTGAAGCGKSALLGRLAMLSFARYRAEVERGGGLVGQVAGTLPPVDAISAGVHARGKSLGDCVRDLRAVLDLPVPGGSDSPAELLSELAARPGTTTVLFDALDEAQAGDVRRIAAELLRPMGELPGVRLLVATRPGATGSLLTDLGAGPAEILRLDDDPDQIADVAAYARLRLRVPGSVYADEPDAVVAPVADAIAAHSRGIFLLARLLARTLARWGAVVDPRSPAVRALFAGGLQSAFVADLERFGPDEKRARALLRALAWGAGRGVPGRDVWLAVARALGGGSYTAADLGWLAEQAGANIVASSEDGQTVYRLYHEAFTEYFRAGADERRIQDAITSALLETVTHDGVRRWADANPYVLRHLAEHAARAGRLRELVADPGFLLHGDPDRLLQAAGAVLDDASPLARVYMRAAAELPGTTPTQRAVALATIALQDEPGAVAALRDTVDLPWRPLWSRTRRTAFHRPLGRHAHPVLCVAVGRLGERDVVVSGGGDHVVRLWDPLSVSGRTAFVGHQAPVFAVVLASVGGREVLVSGDGDGVMYAWDVATGRTIAERAGGAGVLTLAIVADSATGPVVAVGDVAGVVSLHSLPGLEPLDAFPDHHAAVRTVHVMRSRGRSVLVSGGDDGTLRTWGPRATFDTTGYVITAASARVGARPVIATGGYWGTISLWDADTRAVVRSFTGHPRTVNAITFVPTDDGPLLATAGDDGGVRIWDPATGQPVRVLRVGYVVRRTVLEELMGQTTVRALTAGGRVGSEDLDDAAVERRYSDAVLALRFLAVRGRPALVSGGVDGWVRLWDVVPAGGAADTHDTAVTALCTGVVDGTPIVVVGRRSGAVQVVSATSGRLLLDVPGTAGVESLALGTVRGRPCIARGDHDYRLVVLDALTGEPLGAPFVHTNLDLPIYGTAFVSDEERTLLVHTLDLAAVAVVDATTGARRELEVGTNAVVHLSAGPAGTGLVATAALEGAVTISRVGGGPVRRVDAFRLTCRPVFGTVGESPVLAFSDVLAGVVLVSGDPEDAPRTLVAQQHFDPTVTGLAFMEPGPDTEPMLVVTRDDGSARAHDLVDGSVRIELPPRPDAVRAVATVAAGGRLVIACGDDGGVQAVDVDLATAAPLRPAG
jgi:WD40 repeat protein